MQRPSLGFGLVRSLVIGVYLFFVFIPLATFCFRALQDSPWTSPGVSLFWPVLVSTFRFSLGSAFASLGFGILVFFAGLRGWSTKNRGFLFAAFSMPALFAIVFYRGIVTSPEWRYGEAAIIATHAFLGVPWVVLSSFEVMGSTSVETWEVARTLGATPVRALWRVANSKFLRRWALSFAQVFAWSVMSFGVVLYLGGGPPIFGIETEIYSSIRGSGLSMGSALLFSGTQIVVGGLPLLVSTLAYDRRRRREGSRAEEGSESARFLPQRMAEELRSTSPFRWAGETFFSWSIALLWVVLPGFFFGSRAWGDPSQGISKLFWIGSNVEWRSAAIVSLQISALVGALVVGLSFLTVFAWGNRPLLRSLALSPIALSPMVLSLGFFLAYSRWVDPFEGSRVGMILVQTALFLPFAIQMFFPEYEEWRSGSRWRNFEAARTLGASPWRAFLRLEASRWKGLGLRVFAITGVWSVSELAATQFFSSESWETLGSLTGKWLSKYRFADAEASLFWVYVFSMGILIVASLPERKRIS